MPAQSPTTIVVIHARGGSKRIPLKNLKPLGGQPLIAWSIKAALASASISRVIVSTDHDGIRDAALAAGADVPFKRPADIAEDVASELVTQHAARFHEQETGTIADFVITIQPTTPFIRSHDIDGCVRLLADNGDLDSVISVNPVHERPEWMFSRDPRGLMTPLVNTPITGDQGVSQALPPLFHPNGGIYVTRRSVLFDENRLIGARCGGWVMSRLRSVDIDEPVDLILAESVAAYLAAHPDAD